MTGIEKPDASKFVCNRSKVFQHVQVYMDHIRGKIPDYAEKPRACSFVSLYFSKMLFL